MTAFAREAMTFAEFIEQEMTRLHIKSNRKFAERAGVSPQMINDIRNGIPRELDVISLSRIAIFTSTPFMSVLRLAFPEVVQSDLDIEDVRYAEKMSKLPPDKKEFARRFIDSVYAEGGDQ